MTPFPARPAPTDLSPGELGPRELRDPAVLLADLDHAVGLLPGTYVCLVRHSSTDQVLLRVARLEGELDLDEHDPDDSQVLHVGPGEIALLMAWRYANYLPRVFQGELVVATPSGWCTFMGHDGSSTPSLRERV